MRKIIRWLGFYKKMELVIMADPTIIDNYYEARVKILSKTYYWFHIRVWKTTTKTTYNG